MSKKYLVCPGHVLSKNDGDSFFVSARVLMDLYGVPAAECFVKEHGEPLPLGIDTRNLIHLTPRYDGNYALPS